MKPIDIQLNLSRLGYRPGSADGDLGPKSRAALQQFQNDSGLMLSAIASPAALDQVQAALIAERAEVPTISREFIEQVLASRGRKMPDNMDQAGIEALNAAMIEGVINTKDRISHVLAQFLHESEGFSAWKEHGRGRGKRYAPYYGRGPLQLTWRSNYARYGELLGVGDSLVKNPDLVASPSMGFRSGMMYWTDHNMNAMADDSPSDPDAVFLKISREINGTNSQTGLPNGMTDRRSWLGAVWVRL